VVLEHEPVAGRKVALEIVHEPLVDGGAGARVGRVGGRESEVVGHR
jgi:hypothetical protein